MNEYWTSEVEEKLAEYVTSDDMVLKNIIFDKYLHIPLKKLVNDVVKRYKPCAGEVAEDVKTDILTFVVMHVERFNPKAEFKSRKATGWAYCNVLARSYIANYRMKTSRENKNVRFEECHEIHLEKIN